MCFPVQHAIAFCFYFIKTIAIYYLKSIVHRISDTQKFENSVDNESTLDLLIFYLRIVTKQTTRQVIKKP